MFAARDALQKHLTDPMRRLPAQAEPHTTLRESVGSHVRAATDCTGLLSRYPPFFVAQAGDLELAEVAVVQVDMAGLERCRVQPVALRRQQVVRAGLQRTDAAMPAGIHHARPHETSAGRAGRPAAGQFNAVGAIVKQYDNTGRAQVCMNKIESLGFDKLYSYSVAAPSSCIGGADSRAIGKVIVGVGIPRWKLTERWTPDGCSDPSMPAMWTTACNVHDTMYATLAPAELGVAPEQWRMTIEGALLLNLATICRSVWIADAQQLAMCFDAALARIEALRNWLGRKPFEAAQRTALAFKNERTYVGRPELTVDEYREISNFVAREEAAFRSAKVGWFPSGSVLTPDDTRN